MNKELIDRAWACLPKEFKEEVKEIYSIAIIYHPCGYNHKTDLLKYLFGRHNLTSKAEGEETLICEKSKVQRAYNTSREIVKAENPDSLMYSIHTQIMCVLENLFGSKCHQAQGQAFQFPVAFQSIPSQRSTYISGQLLFHLILYVCDLFLHLSLIAN